MKRFSLLALAAASLLATACKKDAETPKPAAPTTEQLLSAHTWRMTALTADPGVQLTSGGKVTNIYPFIDDCTTDDTQQFVAGGQFKADEGASKCNPADAQTVTGTWATAKTGNDTNLTITVSGNTLHLKVLELSDAVLKMSTNEDIYDIGTGSTVTYTMTYSKQ
jgi:hypothetical protein